MALLVNKSIPFSSRHSLKWPHSDAHAGAAEPCLPTRSRAVIHPLVSAPLEVREIKLNFFNTSLASPPRRLKQTNKRKQTLSLARMKSDPCSARSYWRTLGGVMDTVILMEIFPFPGMSLLTGMSKVAFALAASCNSKSPRCLWLEATYFG